MYGCRSTYHVLVDGANIEYRPQKKVTIVWIQLTVYQCEAGAIVSRPGVKGQRNKNNELFVHSKTAMAYSLTAIGPTCELDH